jgi:ATP-dependent Clp protease ATP-binding subunit ClpB
LKAAIDELRRGEELPRHLLRKPIMLLTNMLNLNELAKSGKLDPVIGRDEKLDVSCTNITRTGPSNPMLVGEPGLVKLQLRRLAHRSDWLMF